MITAPSARYLAALRHAHRSQLRVTLYDGGELVGVLPAIACNLSIDGQSNVWRTAGVTLGVDLWDTDTRAYLEQVSVQQGSITIEHGILFADETTDWVLLATLRIDQLTAPLTVASRQINAFDRALLVQEHLFETGRPLNETYANMIQTMLNETLPGEILTVEPGVNTVLEPSPGKSISGGGARLDKIQEFAEAIEGWFYNEPNGSFTLGAYQPAQPLPVWSVDAGAGGVMIDAVEEYSRREQYNAVGIQFTPAEGNDWKVTIFRWDNDPTSPTYYDGPFGKRPQFFTEEYDHLPSTDEALAVATRRLNEYTGATRSLALDAVYNPLLVPGDVIAVTFPDGESENHVIDSVNIELGPSGRMQIGTRLVRENAVYGAYLIGSSTGKRSI